MAWVWSHESSELFIYSVGDPRVKRMEIPSISLEIWQSSAFRDDKFASRNEVCGSSFVI